MYGSGDAWTSSSSSATASSLRSSTSCSPSSWPSTSSSSTSPSSSAPAPSSSSSLPFTLAQLASFRALTTAGSLEAAADATGRHPTKLAATVGRLERDLGFALLAPPPPGSSGHPGGSSAADADEGGSGTGAAQQILASGAPLRLSPAGALLDRYAERLLSLGADALAATRDARELRTGEVYLAASQTTGVYFLPRLIGEFKRAHPGVALQLAVENTRRCCAAVARGEADIALVGGEVPADLAKLLRVEEYAEDEVVLILPPGHEAARRAAKEQQQQQKEEEEKNGSSSGGGGGGSSLAVTTRGSIDVSQLPSLRFVSLHKSSTVQAIRARLEAAGLDWRSLPVVLEVNSVEAIKGAVEAGLGAAFVSAAAVAKEARPGGSLVALRVRGAELRRKLLCVTDPERYLPRAARQFAVEQCGLAVDDRGFVTGSRREKGSESGGGSGGGGREPSGPSSPPSSSSPPPGVPAAGCTRYPHLAGRSPPLSELGGPGSAPRGRAGCPPPSGPARSMPGMVNENASPAEEEAFFPAGGAPPPISSLPLPPPPPAPSSPSSSLCELPFTLAQLAALQAVARTGSGVAAALTLGVSQPAVSKAIAALEAGLACGALLKPGRRGGPTSLTEAGAALLPHAERALAAAREAARALSDLGAAHAGSVRLGASQTVGTYVMPRLLAAFRRANPRVTAQLVVDSSSAVCAAVASGVRFLSLSLSLSLSFFHFSFRSFFLETRKTNCVLTRPFLSSS